MHFEKREVSDIQSEKETEENDQQKEKRIWSEMVTLLDARSALLDQEVLAQIRMKYPDYVGNRPKVESFSHNNIDIQFVGVHHTVETLALYREDIEKQIATADMVILEGSMDTSGEAVSTGGVYDREIFASDRSIAMQYPGYEPDTNSGMAFFYEMENVAKKHQKQIVNLDPFTDRRFLQSRANEGDLHKRQLDALDKKIQSLSSIVAQTGRGVVYGSLGAGLALAGKESIAQLRLLSDENEEASQMSRRKFLQQTGALVAGGAMAQVVENKAQENDRVMDSFFDYDPGQRWAQYNMIDFRDVAIASGIDRLSQSFKRKMKVAVIYGDYHRNGVRRYLENPALRATKQVLYEPFQKIAPPELTAYTYQLDPDVASGQVDLKDVHERDWGAWRQVVRTRL